MMDGHDNKGMYPQIYPGPPPPNQPIPGYAPPNQHMHQMAASQSTTTVVIQQPQTQPQNPLRLVDRHGFRGWHTGLCECFVDISNCMFTWCCYPCAICNLASRTGECLCTPCCVPCTEITLRSRIRTIGGITGNICNDCLTVCFCGPCAACQEARELTAMGY